MIYKHILNSSKMNIYIYSSRINTESSTSKTERSRKAKKTVESEHERKDRNEKLGKVCLVLDRGHEGGQAWIWGE